MMRANSDKISCEDGILWGQYGGELEFVGMRVESIDGDPHCVLLFTEHDVQNPPFEELEPGVHYRLVQPLADTLEAT